MKTMKKMLTGMSAALALMVGVGAANASLLTISGGATIITGSDNDVLGTGWSLQNNAGLSAAAGATLSYYFVGSESGFANTLNTAGGNDDTEGDTIPGFPGNFLFSELSTGASPVLWFTSTGFGGSVIPGGPNAQGSIAFAYLNSDNTLATGPTNRVLFALDDGGASPEDNHDDYVGIISAVPLPAAVWMFGSALIGLAGVGRRKLTGVKA